MKLPRTNAISPIQQRHNELGHICAAATEELKTGKFKPEYAGKMNFYLTAVDNIKKHEDDQPSIGIILCREKNKLVVEYSLRDMDKPIGVPEYKLTTALPASLVDQLPSIDQIEAELQAGN